MNLPKLKDSYTKFSVTLYVNSPNLTDEIENFVGQNQGVSSGAYGRYSLSTFCNLLGTDDGNKTAYLMIWFYVGGGTGEGMDIVAAAKLLNDFIQLADGMTISAKIELGEKIEADSLPKQGFVSALRGLSNLVGGMNLTLNGASFSVAGSTTSSFSWKEVIDDDDKVVSVIAEVGLWQTMTCAHNTLDQTLKHAEDSLKFLVYNQPIQGNNQ